MIRAGAAVAAVFALSISAAQARPAPDASRIVTQFCGDRVCGGPQAAPSRRVHTGGRRSIAVHTAARHAHKRVRNWHKYTTRRTNVPAPDVQASGFAPGIVAEARRYIGGNPTGRGSLWCADFMNLVLARSGYSGTGSRLASSFASYGHRITGPQVGAIAVMSRRRGGHVGVVSGVTPDGNPIIISGNSRGHRVAEVVYPRGRPYAYVLP